MCALRLGVGATAVAFTMALPADVEAALSKVRMRLAEASSEDLANRIDQELLVAVASSDAASVTSDRGVSPANAFGGYDSGSLPSGQDESQGLLGFSSGAHSPAQTRPSRGAGAGAGAGAAGSAAVADSGLSGADANSALVKKLEKEIAELTAVNNTIMQHNVSLVAELNAANEKVKHLRQEKEALASQLAMRMA